MFRSGLLAMLMCCVVAPGVNADDDAREGSLKCPAGKCTASSCRHAEATMPAVVATTAVAKSSSEACQTTAKCQSCRAGKSTTATVATTGGTGNCEKGRCQEGKCQNCPVGNTATLSVSSSNAKPQCSSEKCSAGQCAAGQCDAGQCDAGQCDAEQCQGQKTAQWRPKSSTATVVVSGKASQCNSAACESGQCASSQCTRDRLTGFAKAVLSHVAEVRSGTTQDSNCKLAINGQACEADATVDCNKKCDQAIVVSVDVPGVNEQGVPIVSSLPSMSRVFRNVGMPRATIVMQVPREKLATPDCDKSTLRQVNLRQV